MPEDDHEAAMARADLYKLAQYSAKLFKMIQEGQQLEGWVQAKITKSADYIASVYHFMAYEMKVSEYGEALENAEVYESELRSHLQNRLVEAKEKVKALKKVDAMKHKAHKTDKELEEMRQQANEEKSSTGGETDRSKPGKTKHTQNPNRFSDEPHTEPKSQATSQSAAEKAAARAMDKAEEEESRNWKNRFGNDSVTRVKDGQKVKEGAKPDFLDVNKNGNKTEPMKKALADKKAGPQKGVNPFAKKGAAPKKGVNPFAKKNESIVSAVKSAVGLAKKTPLTTAEKNAASHAANKGKNMPSSGNAADDYDYFTGRDKTLGGETKVKEALKGGQKKLDTDNDNDIDAKDLANLRAKKKDKFKEAAQAKCNSTAKGKSCPVHGMKECGSMYEASDNKKKCPPMSHIKKMCLDKKTVAEICKMHPDCDQTELKQMIAACKKQMAKK